MAMFWDLSKEKYIKVPPRRCVCRGLTATPVRERWGPVPSVPCRQCWEAGITGFPFISSAVSYTHLVILGSSAAGVNAAKEIRRVDEDGEILMISRDETIYSRCILHHYLGNIRTVQQLDFTEPDFTEKYRVRFMKGREAVSVNCEERTVLLADGCLLYTSRCV